jgi:hypothetical protein
MTKQHRATPEQWESIELYAKDNDYAVCFLELRDRIEALEAAQQPHQDKMDRLIAIDRDDPDNSPVERIATDTFRDLCAEILQKLDQYEDGQRVDWDAWRNNARAVLAQPEPAALTDEALLRLAAHIFGYTFKDGGIGGGESEFLAYARAVLARWGTSASNPVPVSERLPLHLAGELDDQGTCWNYHPINLHYCLCVPDPSIHTHWLPHWALPVPVSKRLPEREPWRSGAWMPGIVEIVPVSANALPTPRTPMTDLSPAAQAVLDAADSAFDQAGTTRQGIAAALRAAADQVLEDWNEETYDKLLAIAAELEGGANV